MLYYPIFNIIEKMRMTNELRVIRMRRIQKKGLPEFGVIIISY